MRAVRRSSARPRVGRSDRRAPDGAGRLRRRDRSCGPRGRAHRRSPPRPVRRLRALSMDLIEDIGPILGIVAFLGFAILALLIVLQAREVRRLREWAGRAPERARRGRRGSARRKRRRPEREGRPRGGAREALADCRVRESASATRSGPKWDELDRRSPVDPRLVLGGLLIGADRRRASLTSGFGLVGDDPEPGRGEGRGEAREDRGGGPQRDASGGRADPSRASPTSLRTTSSSRRSSSRGRDSRRAWSASPIR